MEGNAVNLSAKLARIRSLLSERYADLGRQAGDQLEFWLSGRVPFANRGCLEKHLSEEHLELLLDAFYQVLPFGTGGRRGRVGYGANRLNPTTVAMTVQGHCDYLLSAFADRRAPCVVVANDVRVFNDFAGVYGFLGDGHPLLGMSSRSLGRLACEIYAGNGITAYFQDPQSDSAVLTTPELSFLIGQLDEVLGGLNLSASHNPPDDNGLKLYDDSGSQPIPPQDQLLLEAMRDATDIHSVPFDEALAEGLIRAIPADFHEDYVRRYLKSYGDLWEPRPDVPIVYTPLCGCGLESVGDVLERLGFPVSSPPDEGPDGRFPGIPFNAPNPEIPEATLPARTFADSVGSTVVLSSDPDADRVGLEAKLEDGSWYHFDGNQIAALLCYFLMLDPSGPRRRGLVIETLVTSRILGAITDRAGDSWKVDDLLVGFKWVADVLKRLDRDGVFRTIRCSPSDLVLAAEESHGIITSPDILDKDATPACMLLAALHQRLRSEGRNLLDYYRSILDEVGGYDCVNRSIVMLGASGMVRKDAIMESLRRSPPERLAGDTVTRMVDYWDEDEHGPFVSDSDRLPRNVVQMFTERFVLAVRPSGTEAKLKLYVQRLPRPEDATVVREGLLEHIRAEAGALANTAYNELLGRIDCNLGDAALLLPDIVDLDQKLLFQTDTLPKLEERLRAGASSLESTLSWLREETAAMTPGADPLLAVKAPIALECRAWEADVADCDLFVALREWAND